MSKAKSSSLLDNTQKLSSKRIALAQPFTLCTLSLYIFQLSAIQRIKIRKRIFWAHCPQILSGHLGGLGDGGQQTWILPVDISDTTHINVNGLQKDKYDCLFPSTN